MTQIQEEFERLSLLVQRILDAEVLLEAEGDALRGEAETARLSLEKGDQAAVRRHLERLARFTEAHMRAEAVPAADGRAVIQVVDGILRSTLEPGEAQR